MAGLTGKMIRFGAEGLTDKMIRVSGRLWLNMKYGIWSVGSFDQRP